MRHLAIGGMAVGAREARDVTIAGGYLRIADDGALHGPDAAIVTDVRGTQHGLTFGLMSIVDELRASAGPPEHRTEQPARDARAAVVPRGGQVIRP
jgi:hypothetical protein